MGLFSTHTHTHKTTLVPYEKSVTVHEHRAPTDASIRMLNEMQEKAKENILRSMIIDTNEMYGAVIFHQLSGIEGKVLWDAMFILNRKEIKLHGKINRNDFECGYSHETVLQMIVKRFGESIAEEFVNQCGQSIINQIK
jgi:hypothetical protein